MSSTATVDERVPDHVPRHLVKTFDFLTELGDRPQEAISRLHEGPPIFFTPRRHNPFGDAQGEWVVIRADDVSEVMSKPEVFSSLPQGDFMRTIGEVAPLLPLELDPPDHVKFRTLLDPLFSPKRILELESKIRAHCGEILEKFESNGKCEFMKEFADLFPTGVFIDLLGLPKERLVEFRSWNQSFIHGETPEARLSAVKKILEYFRELFKERRVSPTQDMVQYIMEQQIDGRSITESELAGVCFLLFAAGLDTIVNSLTFVFRHLAENQDVQAALRRAPEKIPRYVEEMMRLTSLVTTQRVATMDTELGGVAIKKGDYLAISFTAASRDPARFPNPDVFDIDRPPKAHFAFGNGIHRCIGAQLARRDVAIAIEEWFKRVPTFFIDRSFEIKAVGGGVLALTNLNLSWTVPQSNA